MTPSTIMTSRLIRRHGARLILGKLSKSCNYNLPCCTALVSSFSTTKAAASVGGPLHYEWIQAEKGQDNVLVFLHGLLGNGRNLRTMAVKVCEASQKSGLVLDLPGHGKSSRKGGSNASKTFDSFASDVQTTLLQAGIDKESSITLIGHSLGGRVALEYANKSLSQQKYPRPERLWLLDSVPGKANRGVEQVVAAATELEKRGLDTKDRKHVVDMIQNDFGLEERTALWLASSLVRGEKGYQFAFDLDLVNNLMPEFGSHDYIGVLKNVTEGGGIRVDLVRAGKNKDWDVSVINTLQKMEGPNFNLHVLPKAGHWVHVDDLPGLLDLLDGSV